MIGQFMKKERLQELQQKGKNATAKGVASLARPYVIEADGAICIAREDTKKLSAELLGIYKNVYCGITADAYERESFSVCSTATKKVFFTAEVVEENPMQILVDALYSRGMEWREIMLVTAGICHPLGQLDMAEWVVHNPDATWQEMISEGNCLIKKYELNRI